MNATHNNEQRFARRGYRVFAGFAAIALFLLATEHRAHLFGWLPWLILLACPLMHLFMHRERHDDHRDHGDGNDGGRQ